jgi:Caspase domain
MLKSVIISPCSSHPSRLFALIIGINNYKAVKRPFLNLYGAVPDAELVQSYLQKNLGVPDFQIRNLRDSEATRAAILHEINALTTDDRIQPGDPILIFYAGLGSTAPIPKGWESGGPTVQLLLPHDYLCENEKGQKVHGIPDHTLSVLLGRLASAKGDNIV